MKLTMLKPRVAQLKQGRPGLPTQTAFADPNRGSRHARGYGSAWDKLRKVILARDCGLCQPCQAKGLTTQGRTVDHRVPKAEGGSDDPSNLQTICDDCHRVKTSEEARRGRGG